MHISLDSAIGQQRRLNQVGETINSIAAPAAAYSLRSLTGGDPKVVRVRRESDNTERDFTASGVSSGAMVDFVNAQTIKPLDTRALNSGGSGDRDGDFQIASAAYSLRSLGDRQATVAATGDTVTAADGKYVVQVRRSRDNAIKSFTADEVSDGTLVSFVTEPSTGWNTQPTWNTIAPSGTIRSQSSTASTSTLTFFAYGTSHTISDSSRPSHIVANEGDVVDINLTISNIQGAASVEIRAAGTDTSLASSSTIANGTVGASFTVNSNANGGAHIVFSSLETPSDFSDGTITINSVTVTGKTGFVRTWYDQSVTDQGGGTATGNHAVQATAANQPKIVSSGSLLTDGVDFDGSENVALVTGSFSLTQAYTTISVSHTDTAATTGVSQGIFSTASSASGVFNSVSLFRGDGGIATNSGSTLTTAGTIDYTNNRTYIQTNIVNGGSSSIFVDGATGATGDMGSTNPSGVLILGYFKSSGDNINLDGAIKELIIYDSDQTDNRGAYEGNIADHYGITGVPTGANTVNGFVETWYDQSGNSRPLIQTTASEQPLIVESGSFLNGVRSNKATSNSTMQNLQVSTDGINANFGTDDWASGASSKLGLIYVGSIVTADVPSPSSTSIVWGGGRGVSGFQTGGLSFQVIKSGNDSWRLTNERTGLSPSTMVNSFTLNSDNDVVLYGIADNREFTINVNGSGDTETESADLDTRENTALSLFGSYDANGSSYYQRSTGGVCKECYLYAGTSITNIPTIATKINEHYSIY